MNPWIIALGALALYSYSKKGNGTAEAPQESSGRPQVAPYRPPAQASTSMSSFDAPVSQTVQTTRPTAKLSADQATSVNGNGLDMRFPLRLATMGF